MIDRISRTSPRFVVVQSHSSLGRGGHVRSCVAVRSTGVRPSTFQAPHREEQQQQQQQQQQQRRQGIPARLPPASFSRGEFTTSSASTQHDSGKPADGGPQQLSADLPTTSAPAGRLPPQGSALLGVHRSRGSRPTALQSEGDGSQTLRLVRLRTQQETALL